MEYYASDVIEMIKMGVLDDEDIKDITIIPDVH